MRYGNHQCAYLLDPDGKVSSPASKSVMFYLYYSGKVRTLETGEPNTTWGWDTGSTCQETAGPCAGCDPSWFSWN